MHIDDLQKRAASIREDLIKMLAEAGSGHAAGPLGMADVFTALYFGGVLKYRADDPWWDERDRLVLSCGHIVPVLYATLAHAGFFDRKELSTLRRYGSKLEGHPHHDSLDLENNLPGIESASGPLGQGTSISVGMALGLRVAYERGKISRLPRVVCIDSDGELQEGQVWEAFMAAAKFKLEHLTFVVDRNNIQIDGFTSQVMPVEPLKQKLESFGLFAIEVDGHNIESVIKAFQFDSSVHGKPVVIIAHTTPGKGISYMENMPEWHGKPPIAPGEATEAIRQLHELRSMGGKIICDHID